MTSGRKMKQLLVKLLLAATTLIVLAVVISWVILQKSLPQLEGEIATDGVSADVTIERDGSGIPTITASNRVDLAYATGFVHGQDRFFSMDLTRRKAAGELAEIVGEVAVSLDRQSRFHRFRARANLALERLSAGENQVLQAYSDGVNDGLAGLGAKPFEYFLLGVSPRPWDKADSILVVYAMYLELNDENADRDLRRGMARSALPKAAFDWLYPEGTEWDAPLSGEPRGNREIPGPEQYSLRGISAAYAEVDGSAWQDEPLPGSNNWAVAGHLTDTGAAIVANDMHLGITTPNIFYRARLRVSGDQAIDLNGLTLPGTPILVAGSNGHVAWGNTNSYGDWTDAVIVRPANAPGTYLTPDGVKTFQTYNETILVKDRDPQFLEIRETVWGPLLEETPESEQLIAVSWIAHHPEAVTLGHLELETASSAAEAMRIANTIGMPPQNFVVGDADGNIGWTIAGRIPVRADVDSSVPMDWSQSGSWQGWVQPPEYPRVLNPPSGRIWTANARVTDAEALKIIGDGGYDLGARSKQIRDDLFAVDRFAPTDMLKVHLDDRALFLNRWRDLLLDTLNEATVAGNDKRAQYRQLVNNWIPRAATDSVGYRLVRDFRREVDRRVVVMTMQPVLRQYGSETRLRISNQFEGPLWSLVTEKPAHLLTDEYANWDELLLQAIDTNIEAYTNNYSGGLEKRTWGERNTAAIRHPLSRAVPFLSRWIDMPADQLNGDSNMPRVQFPAFGASERFAVSPGDEANGYLHMPAGQSGHPLSDYYRKGHDDWVRGRPSSFLPGPVAHRLSLIAGS
jgi:penicillin amidase